MRSFLIFVLLVLLAAGVWLGWALGTRTTPAEEQVVVFRPGASSRHIAEELQRHGIIRSANAFFLYHYLSRAGSLKAGEYQFDHPANPLEVHRRLVRGDVLQHEVTIPEGFNIFEIAAALQAAGLGSREEFLQVARSQTALISDLDPRASSLEGYLFPDSYQFTRTQTGADLAVAMVRRFRRQAEEIGLAPGADMHRIVTLASIVEKETAVPEERPLVASVYYNRLANDIPLAADPCVIYGALLAGRFRGAIYQSDLQSDSPYNTYKVAGLPPGPIANPGRGALMAALHPAHSDDLYFVSDNNGHHRFARTLDEHSRNVALYRRRLNAPDH